MGSQIYREHYLAALEVAHSELDNILRELRAVPGVRSAAVTMPHPLNAAHQTIGVNAEGTTPPEPRGYYHEYTVKTPGVRTRGARRIICGGAIASTSECYYSDDHYRSFKRIRQ